MNYAGVELDSEQRALECPICHNTERIDNGMFCIICGRSLVNLCTENETALCGEPLPGNARYCPYCGNMTTFLKNGALKEWNYKELQNDDIMDIMEDDDSILPF